jgi:hypothetical protein
MQVEERVFCEVQNEIRSFHALLNWTFNRKVHSIFSELVV